MERDREIRKLLNVLRRIVRGANFVSWKQAEPDAARFCVSQYNKVLGRLVELEPAAAPVFNSSFCLFNSALAGSSFGSADAVSAGSALSPAIQRPCLVMPIGKISYLLRSSASITALAETSETSCSPD